MFGYLWQGTVEGKYDRKDGDVKPGEPHKHDEKYKKVPAEDPIFQP